MIWKRYIPIAIVGFFGSLTLFGWFIENEGIKAFIDDDATQWYDIIASFAIFLGALNLLKLQFLKVLKRQSGWQYSVVAIVSFFIVFVMGFFMRGAFVVDIPNTDVQSTYFTQGAAEEAVNQLKDSGVAASITPAQWGAHIQTEGGLFKWMFDNIFTPLSATMFALLAFYVASASYRAFRARNFEATLLLLAGIIIMIGRVPIGSLISSWTIMYLLVLVIGIIINTYFKNRKFVFGWIALGLIGVTVLGSSMGWPIDQPAVFYLPALQEWIYTVPNLAGARAIMIGIGLGIIVTSLRYIFGLEKSYIGDQ
ncbi:MAG: hypothetical protein VX703_00375 [Candidatus Neomarinimicrobiota bacterium]|nr:hypothetical protein [Candidatus Neomarinimicrobiota bacterium]MEC9455232.1 hypothetical protein [Candidatus Neomarinimicrobiota bacterium]MED5451288.1 hypothetical protein [Candidatus Neomarinimicrobiota bacterium]MEE3241463.1 hypothetical protein [Candidatus Neomarinimicrobiota bacterium]